jgi:ribonuclease-3
MTLTTNSTKEFQRLEFLGDRILNLIIAEYLYRHNPEHDAGKLTHQLRFTSNDNLDEILDQLDAGFRENLVVFKSQYKPDAQNISADDVEAYIGSFFLQNGFEATRTYIERNLGAEIDLFDPGNDYKSKLNEFCQKNKKSQPVYDGMTDHTTGDNRHEFRVRVLIGQEEYGEGSGDKKVRGEQQAACRALEKLGLEK